MIDKIKKNGVIFSIMSFVSFLLTKSVFALGPELGEGDSYSTEDNLEFWWNNIVYILNLFISVLIIIIGIVIVFRWISYANAKDDRQSQEAKDGLRRGFIGIAILGIGIIYVIITLISYGQGIGQ